MGSHSPSSSRRWSLVQIVLVFLNVMTTWITLFTGLSEDPVVSSITGRYGIIKHRLQSGSINTDIIEFDMYSAASISTPQELAGYRFITSPRRNIQTFGMDVSVCRTINSNAAPVMLSNYDDFWGKTSRRLQIYVNSISAPRCDVLNVKPTWYDHCVTDHYDNATQCHESILANFETLRKNRLIRIRVVQDLGVQGKLFLRCYARPLVPFVFEADRLAHQAYWNGGDFHVTLQTSDCHSVPLVQSADLDYTLFEVLAVDDSASMLILIPPSGWLGSVIGWTQAIVKLALIARGIILALFHTKAADYLPDAVRYPTDRPWLRYLVPFMEVMTKVSGNARAIITFKGSLLMLSDVWMNHWLYIWLCMIESVMNLRATYVMYQIASSLLIVRITLVGMIYLCQALTKITWIMCLVQTVLRELLKLVVRCLRSIRLIKSGTREKIESGIDGISLFLSYRIYYLMLFIITMAMTLIKGDPSFMVRTKPYKVGSFGGPVAIAGFWGSEVAGDLVTLLAMLTAAGYLFGGLMLCTRYRYVANNRVLRFLQDRYFIAGWDGLMAANMLGLDPYIDGVVVDEVAYTRVSVGSLLQLLYLSGPSGFVHLGGDYIFHDNGFSKEPVRFSYPIAKAMSMGLFENGNGSTFSSNMPSTATTTAEGGQVKKYASNSLVVQPARGKDSTTSALTAKQSIFERKLRIVSDGYLGKILFVDAKQAGQLTVNKETGQREFEVIDALTTMSILDIKYLMGNEKKIRMQ